MYVNPFVAGIAVTIMAEMALIIVVSLFYSSKQK